MKKSTAKDGKYPFQVECEQLQKAHAALCKALEEGFHQLSPGWPTPIFQVEHAPSQVLGCLRRVKLNVEYLSGEMARLRRENDVLTTTLRNTVAENQRNRHHLDLIRQVLKGLDLDSEPQS